MFTFNKFTDNIGVKTFLRDYIFLFNWEGSVFIVKDHKHMITGDLPVIVK